MLLKNIFTYSTINMLNASVPFFLLPVLTRFLSTEQYGYLSVYQLLIMMLLPFITINIQSAINVEYFKLPKDELEKYIGSIVVIPVFMWCVFSLIFYYIGPYVENMLNVPVDLLYLLPTFALLQYIPLIVMSLSQVKIDIKMFAFFKLGLAAINFVFTLIFVISLLEGWHGRLYAILLSYLIFTVIGVYVLRHQNYLKIKIDVKYIKNALIFGLPLIPHVLAGTLLSMSDRLIMANMLSMKDVGVYSVAFQISAILMIIFSSVNQAWVPHLFNKLKQEQGEYLQIVKYIYLIMLTMLIFFVVFVFVSPYLFDILIDKAFSNGKSYIMYIALGFLFQGFYLMKTNFLFFKKKTHILALLTVFSALFNIVVAIYFIKLYGAIGSAYAMCMTWLLFWLLTWIVVQRVHPMPWLFTRRSHV